MKKIVFFQLALTQICTAQLLGQNVGINTTTPQSTLDVRGNQRIGGSSRFMSFDSVSGRITWTSANLFMPAAQAIIQHSASAEGLFYNNGQIEYRNQIGNPVFFTNWPSGNGYFRGKLGIGTTTPTSPLHIVGQESTPNGLNAGLQISNQADGTGNNWHIRAGAAGTNTPPGGFSISDNNGYWFNITNNGYVGLSTTTPRSPLSFAPYTGNKISLWDDGNAQGYHYGIGIENAKLQIHTYAVTDDIVFGWGKSSELHESVRIRGSGAIAINQNFGTSGQLLQSNGNYQPATWVNKVKYYYFEQPAPFALTTSYQDVPGVNDVLFNIDFPCNLIITVTSRPYRKMNEPVQYASASFGIINHTTGIGIFSGLQSGGDLPDFGPGTYTTNHFTSTGYLLNVQPGPYRISYRAVKSYVGGNCELTSSQIIIQAIPL